jgi:hypothetical protein
VASTASTAILIRTPDALDHLMSVAAGHRAGLG